MLRIFPVGAVGLACLVMSCGLSAQTPETRSDDSAKEILVLKRTVADQERRIAMLERTVTSMQNIVLAASRNSSRPPEGWAALKMGMSRALVVDILGEPKTTESVIDRQTLLYMDANGLVGKVIITDDRVSDVSSRFRTHNSSQK